MHACGFKGCNACMGESGIEDGPEIFSMHVFTCTLYNVLAIVYIAVLENVHVYSYIVHVQCTCT